MKGVKRRPRHRMPSDIRTRLSKKKLLAAYRARPPYQRNDYLGWIRGAKRASTREKRIGIMLGELAAGHGYMKLKWQPSKATTRRK